MAFSPQQEQSLGNLGQALLHAFKCIAHEAKNQLTQARSATNPILPDVARRNLEHINADNQASLRALAQEPSIARVEVQWADTRAIEELYVCRASSAGVFPPDFSGRLVSYRSAMGRFAEIPAGETIRIVTPKGKRQAVVRERVQLHPNFDEAGWDSRANEFEFTDWQVVVDSLRRLLKHTLGARKGAGSDFLATLLAEQETRELYQDQRRRRTVERMALRDQPVLDKYQGAVFRMPLDKRAVLLGPPGTGKTTTLIRRIAQKRTPEALTEDEVEHLDRYGLKAEFMSGDNWVMFSPTELLKLYVREAFNRESVPAASWNLRTWDAERLSLGRETFRFLKGASSGRLTIANTDDLIRDTASPSLAALHDEFSSEVDSFVMDRCAAAFHRLEGADNSVANRALGYLRSRRRTPPFALDDIHAMADDNEIFRSTILELTETIEAQQRGFADSFLLPSPIERVRELSEMLRRSTGEPVAIDDDEDDEGPTETTDRSSTASEGQDQAEVARFLLRGIGRLAQYAIQGRVPPGRGNIATLLQWLGTRAPSSETLLELGTNIDSRRNLRILESGGRSLVFDVPNIYMRYRRRCIEHGKWYQADAKAHANVLSPSEADIVLLVMLRNARRALGRLANSAWLKPVASKYLMQVAVDEATDFSCVQLACMLELSHPNLRSWFACGDLRQRITRFGITSEEEIKWIGEKTGAGPIEVQHVGVNYRQSSTLQALSEALASGIANAKRSGPAVTGGVPDPSPLLAEGLTDPNLANWLSERILEVERSVGRLPSIAVFVDGEERIDSLVDSVTPILAQNNIAIVGCHDGRDVGNSQEVRVFDIRHIKGLEFEAVFFVGIDSLADRLPDLVQKYLYVGITRAATFLALTCENKLPQSLEFIRPLLFTSNWNR
jgi:hypothetical protein